MVSALGVCWCLSLSTSRRSGCRPRVAADRIRHRSRSIASAGGGGSGIAAAALPKDYFDLVAQVNNDDDGDILW